MLRMFSVLDKAVGAFDRPFCARAKGEAVRQFSDAVNDSQSPFFKHPADFELYCVGVFDPGTGIVSEVGVDRVVTALDVLNKM